jgi:hypothetical protein
MVVAGPLPEPVKSLVRAAVECDEPEQLIVTAQHALGKPLGLAGPSGEALGRAPNTDAGDRALAIARAAATNRLVAPPGWSIVSVVRASSQFGFLAIGEWDGDDQRSPELVELFSTLLADQLQRVALLRARTGELLRRLVADPDVGPAQARREAAHCGLMLADTYWPAILGWRGAAPRPDVADAIEVEARANGLGALSVMLAGRIVLLHPTDGAAAGSCPVNWFGEVAGRAQHLARFAGPQVIVGERALGLGELSAGVAKLDALWRLEPGARGEQPLVSVRHYALDRLFARLADATEATEFVRTQVGAVLTWDRRHHANLLGVLEAGLDFPRHDVAATRCYMHRNTFRHHFRHATELLGDGLEDPEVRLAVHVALKLQHVLGSVEAADGADEAPAGSDGGGPGKTGHRGLGRGRRSERRTRSS